MAPEVIKGDYGKECDIWALGVTLYNLVTGGYPFIGVDAETTFNLIKNFEPDFPEEKKISSECKELILRMLEKDPCKRIKIEEILNHRWITENKFKSEGHSHDVKLKNNFTSEIL